MSPARRSRRKADWPRGMYEPRQGYYIWRHPDGRTLIIGRVPLAVAKSEAIAANLHIEGQRPTLLERVAGSDKTMADVLDNMGGGEQAKNTAKTLRTFDKRIREGLGSVACYGLTVAKCAAFVEAIEAEGKARTAQAVRSRLIAVCRRAMQLGYMDNNPAEVTREASVTVKRGRLTLESYKAIRAQADAVNGWLGLAMDLALVTGADRSTIASLQRRMIVGDRIEYTRSKTGIRISVPLSIELRAAGLNLANLVKSRTGIVSQHLLHHTRAYGNAPKGSQVFVDNISKAFTAARELAGIPDDGAPTFHEIRSLSKRLYEAQGNVDTRWLLGHADEKTAAKYADPRGVEAVQVRVDPLPAFEHEVNRK